MPFVSKLVFVALSNTRLLATHSPPLSCLLLLMCFGTPTPLPDPQMRHLATYMLLVLGGNASPTKEDVTAALSAVGVDVSLPPCS